MRSEPFPILVTYAYLRELPDAFIRWLFRQKDLRVLLDSGAFTAYSSGDPIDVEEYIAFLKDHKSIKSYMALDVINDPKGTRKNLRAMWKADLKPIPVFVTGEKKPWLDELYKHNDVVAIPLSLPVSTSIAVRRLFARVRMQWAAGRKVHWFGFTDRTYVAKHKPYSCDSSSWKAPLRYGTLRYYRGRGRWLPNVRRRDYRRDMTIRATIGNRLMELGYNFEDLDPETAWKGSLADGVPYSYYVAFQLTIDSMVRYVRDIRQRFKTIQYLAVLSGALPYTEWGELNWLIHHVRGTAIANIKTREQAEAARWWRGEKKKRRSS